MIRRPSGTSTTAAVDQAGGRSAPSGASRSSSADSGPVGTLVALQRARVELAGAFGVVAAAVVVDERDRAEAQRLARVGLPVQPDPPRGGALRRWGRPVRSGVGRGLGERGQPHPVGARRLADRVLVAVGGRGVVAGVRGREPVVQPAVVPVLLDVVGRRPQQHRDRERQREEPPAVLAPPAGPRPHDGSCWVRVTVWSSIGWSLDVAAPTASSVFAQAFSSALLIPRSMSATASDWRVL